jgi:hypothetical protein
MRGCQLRPFGHIALALCAAGSLAACTEVVDSVVDSRYGEYNRQTDWAKNEAILLNIVRASEYQPLNFMSFQPYTGTASVSGAASSPSFIIGPARVASQKQYTLGQGTLTASASGTGTVGVTMLDTQNFYQAVFDPVDFTDLNTFQRQGYPRELLFRLFTNYVTLRPVDPRRLRLYSTIVYNDPLPANQCVRIDEIASQLYARPTEDQRTICFSNLVEFALLSGLSSETRSAPNAAASPAKANANANNSQNGSSQNSTAPQTEGRLCFDPALATRYWPQYYQHEMENIQAGTAPDWLTVPSLNHFMAAISVAQYHPVCGLTTGADQWATTATTSGKAVGGAGKAAGAQPAGGAQQAGGGAGKAAADQPAGGGAGKATGAQPAAGGVVKTAATPATAAPKPGVAILKVVVPEKTGSPVWDIHSLGADTVEIGTRSTFAMYNFLGKLLSAPESSEPGMNSNRLIGSQDEDSDRFILTVTRGQPVGCFVAVVMDLGEYCVPIDGAQNTKRIFSILSQLLALKTTTGDLQLTPTLRLIP